MKALFASGAGLILGITIYSMGHTQTIEKKSLNLEGAKKVIAAALAEAKIKNAPGGAIAGAKALATSPAQAK